MMGYLERLDSYKDEMIKTLAESVSIPSVVSGPVRASDGAELPMGRAVHDALLHMLECGRSMGFEAVNLDNLAGYIQFSAGSGPKSSLRSDSRADSEADPEEVKRCDIVGHIDVVPEGTGWTGDPYIMEIKDGVMYGRGTADDKGPVIAALYAMKAVKEEGPALKHDVRLVLGIDEETGSDSIDHYADKCGHPDMGFTPDGMFPLVNGEMGILEYTLAQKLKPASSKDELRLTRLEAGTAVNIVPKDCRAVIAGDKQYFDGLIAKVREYAEETGYKIKARKQGSSLCIEAAGKAAHGAHPESGLNALSIMMGFLGRVDFACRELNDYIDFYNEHIGFDLHGERFGCKFEDDPSGPLILNAGTANIDEELAEVSIGIRYPVTFTEEQVISGIEQVLEGTSVGIVSGFTEPPIYMPSDTPMVEKLLRAYTDETGDHETGAMVEAGGTYAKMIHNTLAFGGMFPGEEDTMHQADEKLSIDSFMKMARIYARAIVSLCCE